MLLKALEMLRHSINATAPRLVCYIILTCSMIRSSAIVVDLPSLAPIWVSSNRPLLSASLDILLAMIASRVFANVFRRTISLYAPSLV